MEAGWGVLLDIGDSKILNGWEVGSVFFGFRVADMVNVGVVRYCT